MKNQWEGYSSAVRCEAPIRMTLQDSVQRLYGSPNHGPATSSGIRAGHCAGPEWAFTRDYLGGPRLHEEHYELASQPIRRRQELASRHHCGRPGDHHPPRWCEGDPATTTPHPPPCQSCGGGVQEACLPNSGTLSPAKSGPFGSDAPSLGLIWGLEMANLQSPYGVQMSIGA